MQRILDLDLDFFLDGVEYYDSPVRLDPDYFHPWSSEEVERFLQVTCKLPGNARIPGRVVTHHDEAFIFWRELIESGELDPPFEVVHVDAHADLSFLDYNAVKYFLCELLHLDESDRVVACESSGHINKGNYLLAAIACGWVEKLTFIPCEFSARPLDVPPHICPNDDIHCGEIQLRKCDGAKATKLNSNYFRWQDCTINVLPSLPFEISEQSEWSNSASFDCIVLSKSPNFTPPTADKLIPVIANYLLER